MTHLPRRRPASQAGFMLLEVLCAILIFTVGVLALIGLQTVSIQQAAAAEYRSTAELAANDLVSRMWITDRSYTTLSTNFVSSGTPAAYAAWWAQWQPRLPGTSTTTLAPTVTITSQAAGASTSTPSSLVSITMQWKAPTDSAAHTYQLQAQIK